MAQLKQIKKMGPLSSIIKMIPGMSKYNIQVDDKETTRIEAIITSMTDEERKNPKILNASRRIRIANGSGTQVSDINKFMKSFEMTRDMMKKMKNGKMNSQMKKMMKDMNLDKYVNEEGGELNGKN